MVKRIDQTCKHCDRFNPPCGFGRDGRKKHGISNICEDCRNKNTTRRNKR